MRNDKLVCAFDLFRVTHASKRGELLDAADAGVSEVPAGDRTLLNFGRRLRGSSGYVSRLEQPVNALNILMADEFPTIGSGNSLFGAGNETGLIFQYADKSVLYQLDGTERNARLRQCDDNVVAMRGVLILLLAAALSAQENWPYVTYIGGSGDDTVSLVTSDESGNTFLAGRTSSVGPPFSNEPPGFRSGSEVFLMKADPRGRMVFLNVLGSGFPGALAVDKEGSVFIAGQIAVTAEFATSGAFQTEARVSQAFLAKFGPDGKKLFATYFGTGNGVVIRTLSLDPAGRPVFCGSATGDTVPLTASSLFPPEARRSSGFCAQLSADGSELLMSTLLAKPGGFVFPFGSVFDANGDLLVAGSTLESAFPSVNAFQSEDRRRSLFRGIPGSGFESAGGPDFGAVVSIQAIGREVFVGSSDSGGWVSTDGGDNWSRISGSPAGFLAVHPLNTRLMCTATASQQVSCSTDGGGSWQTRIFNGATGIVPDRRLEGGFFVTTNQATGGPNYVTATGTGIAVRVPPPFRWLTSEPTGNRFLMVDYLTRGLHLSEDAGLNFRKIADNIAVAAFAPSKPERIYAARFAVAGGSKIVRSDDRGATWTDTMAEAELNRAQDLVVDPADPDTVYVVLGNGAFRSTDAGGSWQIWTPPGLGNLAVRTMRFDDEGRAWAGTIGAANGFLMKLNLNAPSIEWSTVFGGAGGGPLNSLHLDEPGNILLTGSTVGFDLPVTGDDLGPRQIPSGFVARFDAAGQLGALRSLGVIATSLNRAKDGSLHLAATTNPSNLGAREIENGTYGGGASDAVWLTLAPDLSRMTRARWLGGSAADGASAIHLGSDGRIRMVGFTSSLDLPASPDAFQRQFGLWNSAVIGADGFLAIAPIP